MPPVKVDAIESPSPFTPLGTKGMGEGGGAPMQTVGAAIRTRSVRRANRS